MPAPLTPQQQARHDAILAVLAGDDAPAITDLMRGWHASDLAALNTAPRRGEFPPAIGSALPGLALTRVDSITVSQTARIIAARQLALREEGAGLARRVLAALGIAWPASGTGGWHITAYATPQGTIGLVNLAAGVAAATTAELPPDVAVALTCPGQAAGPQVSGAAAWASPDPGEGHRATAPDGWVQLLCDLRGGEDLPPLPGITATLTHWCLRTCYGEPGEPGWMRLEYPLHHSRSPVPDRPGDAADAGWLREDPRLWPASDGTRQAMDDAGRAALEAIAGDLAAQAGAGDVITAALGGDGSRPARVAAALAAIRGTGTGVSAPRDPARDALEAALGDGIVSAALRDCGITRLAWACGDTSESSESNFTGQRIADLIGVLLHRILMTRLRPAAEALVPEFAGDSRLLISGHALRLETAPDALRPAAVALAGRVLARPAVTASQAIARMQAVYAAAGPVTVSYPLPMPGPWDGDEPAGLDELAARLGVTRATVDAWRQRARAGEPRRLAPLPAPTWTVGGRPAWRWAVIRGWARQTGRWPWAVW